MPFTTPIGDQVWQSSNGQREMLVLMGKERDKEKNSLRRRAACKTGRDNKRRGRKRNSYAPARDTVGRPVEWVAHSVDQETTLK